MSTKKTTDQTQSQTSTINYNPAGMGTYNAFQPLIQSNLTEYMKNPLQSSFFAQQAGLGMKAAQAQGSTGMQAMLRNLPAMGGSAGANSPFVQAMIARNARATSGNSSNAFMSALMNAANNRLQATGMAQAYTPLLQGQSSTGTMHGTETTSGLGTWLPQLAGAAIGGVANGLTGGAAGLLSKSLGSAMPFMTGGAPSASSSAAGVVPGMFSPGLSNLNLGAFRPSTPSFSGWNNLAAPSSPFVV